MTKQQNKLNDIASAIAAYSNISASLRNFIKRTEIYTNWNFKRHCE